MASPRIPACVSAEYRSVRRQLCRDTNRAAEREMEEPWGWVVACSCFWTYLIILGLQRSAALVYVALLGAFGLNRREAAWPVAVCSSTMFLVGPLAGALAHRFSIRVLVSLGLVIAGIGVIMCYFANSLTYIIICFGIIQGFGDSMVLTLNPVIINQYFDKHRATANGIAFAGASVGSIILPPATEAILSTYGLRGCFLLLGAINFQGLVGSFLYRSPTWIRNKKALVEASEKQCQAVVCTPKSLKNASEQTESLLRDSKLIYLDNGSCAKSTDKFAKWKDSWRTVCSKLKFVKTPIFIILCINYTSFFICYIAYSITLVDFAKDRGITELDATFCISAFSVGDLCGRLASGWLSDLGYVKRKNALAIGLFLLGAFEGLIPLAYSYSFLLGLSIILGILTGSVIVLFPVLMTEFLGLEQLPMCLGVSGFVMGVVSLCLPALIGVFRDVVGYYDFLYYTLALLAMSSSLLWLFQPLFRLAIKLKESISTTRSPQNAVS